MTRKKTEPPRPAPSLVEVFRQEGAALQQTMALAYDKAAGKLLADFLGRLEAPLAQMQNAAEQLVSEVQQLRSALQAHQAAPPAVPTAALPPRASASGNVVIVIGPKGAAYQCTRCNKHMALVNSNPPIFDVEDYWSKFHKQTCSAQQGAEPDNLEAALWP